MSSDTKKVAKAGSIGSVVALLLIIVGGRHSVLPAIVAGSFVGYFAYEFKKAVKAAREAWAELIAQVAIAWVWLKKPHPFVLFYVISTLLWGRFIHHVYVTDHRIAPPPFLVIFFMSIILSLVLSFFSNVILLFLADIGGSNRFFGRKQYWYPSQYFDLERYQSFGTDRKHWYQTANRIRTQGRKPTSVGYVRVYWLTLVGLLMIPFIFVSGMWKSLLAFPKGLKKFFMLVHEDKRVMSGISAGLGAFFAWRICYSIDHRWNYHMSIVEVLASLALGASLGALAGVVLSKVTKRLAYQTGSRA